MEKKLGQFFTDKWIVELILDMLDYTGKKILNKKIMEPSCGDGSFLFEIVSRYIIEAKKENYSTIEIKKSLEKYIYGIELDVVHFNSCIDKLNELTLKYNIKNVKWQIYNLDTLYLTDFEGTMDFVVGNPPYVRIHNLNKDTRVHLKENFLFCKKGSTDLYVAFYELGIKMLTSYGKLGFITPNSFMFNSSSEYFREYIREKKLMSKIINFGSERIFDASTYNAIVILENGRNSTNFELYKYIDNKKKFIDLIDLNRFCSKNWYFHSNKDLDFIENKTFGKDKIENFYVVQYSLTTLRDKIYISDNIVDIDKETCYFNNFKIEKKILKKIVKGSTFNGEEITSKIIFPYEEVNGLLRVIPKNKLKKDYPLTYEYFLKNKEELLKRDIDKNYDEWYQFGRSQGLTNILKEKLVIKHIVKNENNGKIQVFNIPEDVVIYSGIFITGANLNKLKRVLETEDFFKYIILTSKDMRGGYKSISTKLIKKYCIK